MSTQVGVDVASSPKSDIDLNQNVLEIPDISSENEKDDSKVKIIDTQDNWMGKFLYGGPIGYTVNFTLLVLSTAYLVITLKHEDEYHRKIIETLWKPTVDQFFFILIPTDLILCAVIVGLLFPLTCVSRGKMYNWFLGVTCSVIIFVLTWFVREKANMLIRCLLIINWGRLSMKVAAFLIECSQNDQVYQKSSIKSLLYFLFIPNLVYSHQYPRARRIRWIKVFCHIGWIFGGGLAVLLFIQQFVPLIQVDLMTVRPAYITMMLATGVLAAPLAYPVIAWFFIFENFCGLHGELLRYPRLKFFGSPAEMLFGGHPALALNALASRWFSRYIYVPIIKTGGYRVQAMWLTMSLSLLAHDLGNFYVTNLIIAWTVLGSFTIAPAFMTLQPKNKLVRLFGLCCAGIYGSCLAVSYFLEILAWNYSSYPHLDQQSRLRLVPLFVVQLYDKFLQCQCNLFTFILSFTQFSDVQRPNFDFLLEYVR